LVALLLGVPEKRLCIKTDLWFNHHCITGEIIMLKRLSFNAILYSGFGIVLALVLLVGIYSFQQIRFAIQNYKYVVNWQTDPLEAVSAINILAESEVATPHHITERYKKFLALKNAIEDFHSKMKTPSHPNIAKPQQKDIVPDKEKKEEALRLRNEKEITDSWENVQKNILQERDALLAEYEMAFAKIANQISSYQQSLKNIMHSEKSTKEDPLVLLDQSREAFTASWKNLKDALVNGKRTTKAEKTMQEKGALVLKVSKKLMEKVNEQNLAIIDKAHSVATKAGIRILVVLFFAVLVSAATAFLIVTAAAKKVTLASTELDEVSKIVHVTAQKQVEAFQKALMGIENIKTAFGEIQTNTNQAVSTAKQLLEVSKRLTKM
jgi:hypothetical protein